MKNSGKTKRQFAGEPEALRRKRAIIRRVTEKQRNAEKALRESEKKYRTLFETMVQGVAYHAADGTIVSANPSAKRILGLSLNRTQGRTSASHHQKAIHEDGSDFPGETHPSIVALKTGKQVPDVVMGVFNPTQKKYVWINVTAIPQFKTGERFPYQVYTTFKDITFRRESEKILQASEQRFRELFNHTSSCVAVYEAPADGTGLSEEAFMGPCGSREERLSCFQSACRDGDKAKSESGEIDVGKSAPWLGEVKKLQSNLLQVFRYDNVALDILL